MKDVPSSRKTTGLMGSRFLRSPPQVVAVVPARTKRHQTVREGLTNRQWVCAISGGLPIPAIADYLALWDILEAIVLNDQLDATIWRWTPSGSYTARSAYAMLHEGAIQFRGHNLIWKTWAPLRVKIFLWLAFRRRHWTGDCPRHGLEARERCYLCDHAQETIDHIVVSYPYTREVLNLIYQAFGRVFPPATQSIIKWWRRVRADWTGSRRSGIDSLFALISWEVWKQRNACCFRDAAVTPADLLPII